MKPDLTFVSRDMVLQERNGTQCAVSAPARLRDVPTLARKAPTTPRVE
jgi:hypothetical protein